MPKFAAIPPRMDGGDTKIVNLDQVRFINVSSNGQFATVYFGDLLQFDLEGAQVEALLKAEVKAL